MKQLTDLHRFSEASLISAMSHNMLSYWRFMEEIHRRIMAGEAVHPYHARIADWENALKQKDTVQESSK